MTALEIVWDCLDPWIAQEPEKTKEQLAYMMAEMVDLGVAKFYQQGDSIFFVVRNTPFVAEVHLFSKANNFKLVRNVKNFLTDFWRTTQFIKLHASFTLKKECGCAKRCGFKEEGIREKSHVLKTGEIVDVYLYGVRKWEQ